MDIQKLLLQNQIAKNWTLDTRNTYQSFYQCLTKNTPLIVKIGKGGLSFYKEIQDNSVFVCHFNAMPQQGKHCLGFADFRFDSLRQHLDIDKTVQLLQEAASPEVQIKINKLWCNFHFPLTRADEIANLFTKYIISKVK